MLCDEMKRILAEEKSQSDLDSHEDTNNVNDLTINSVLHRHSSEKSSQECF